MSFWCEVCLSHFTTIKRFNCHCGDERNKILGTTNHERQKKELSEAKQIWNNYYKNLDPIPLMPKGRQQQLRKPELEVIADGIKVIRPLGTKKPGTRGTIVCSESACKGAAHIHFGGLKDFKVFKKLAYELYSLANSKTTNFTYVQWCTLHGLYRYDGVKTNGSGERSTDAAHYISGKVNGIRSLRKLFQDKFKGRKPTEAELVQFILEIRKDNNRHTSDSFLHFMRDDCHPLNFRMDVTAVYATPEEAKKNEAKQQSESESYKYWLGGHNQRQEGTHSVNNTEFRAPTAFYMLAPMDNLTNLHLWMSENGVKKFQHYHPTTLIQDLKSEKAELFQQQFKIFKTRRADFTEEEVHGIFQEINL